MTVSHLRYAGLPFDQQRRALAAILRADPILWDALERARDFALPDWLIVSGAIYNTAWNALTGRASGYGLKDIDLFYCDTADLSWEAEDRLIRAGQDRFSGMAVPVEIRNQARVHLWFPDRFGIACPRYSSSAQSLSYFASKTHAVGIRLDQNDRLEVVAPFGLDFLFSFRLVGNPVLDNRATHQAKGARAVRLWPEVVLEAWPEQTEAG